MNSTSLLEKIFIESHNEEISQARARIFFLGIFIIYILSVKFFLHTESIEKSIYVISFLGIFYSLFHLIWITNSPLKNVFRRMIAIFVDVSLVTTGMYYLEWTGMFILSIYLWIIIGNGMRFGASYLFIAMFLTLLEFSTLLYITPFWINNQEIGFGFIGMIISLPLFFLVMINRLKNVNKKLQEQLSLQKQQEAMLIQQSRHAAMGEMISNIAHQWRQPLNALGLVLQNLENAYEMDVLDEKYLNRSTEKGNKLINSMSNTIDDFRDFFKPNKRKEFFNINEVIQSSLEIMNASLKNANIEVNFNLHDTNNFNGYKNEFSQVVLNIVANAKDALVEQKIDHAKITIESYKKDNLFIINFSDNAGGIPENILDKIFDPYFTTKEHINGTGIGLYMSRLIVKEHLHGDILVKNIENGAMLTIMLPINSNLENNGKKN